MNYVNEDSLAYWREDPLLNEHHEHWHLVWPYDGWSLSGADEGHVVWNDRHGELFAYMHAQFLARYEAERLSVGLDPVAEFNDYLDPIQEGYDPGPGTLRKWNGVSLPTGSRPDGARLSDLTVPDYARHVGGKLSEQALCRDRLMRAARSGSFALRSSNRDVDLNSLSERIEATDRAASPYFGSLHNYGHLHISLFDNDIDHPGVLFHEATAVRDPVFFQWHRHIDNIFRAWQATLEPHDFEDRPSVVVEDLSLQSANGGRNQLSTELRSRQVRTRRGRDPSMTINYLTHADFSYEIAARSLASETVCAVFRIFMVPGQFSENPSAWIEMDKFHAKLEPGKNIVRRCSDVSTVVRHPVLKSECLEEGVGCPDERGTTPGCRCGWPYTLLLPRGWEHGMPCQVMVMASSGDDLANAPHTATSASYCGLQDADYPDVRPMGYPFDRNFASSIAETIQREPQMALADVTLRHQPRQ